MSELTKEQEKECVNAFNIFDKAKMGSIPANQLGMAMRLAGQAPTEVQVSQILTELDRLSPDSVLTLEEFLGVMKRSWKSKEEQEEALLNAFSVFDKLGAGVVAVEEIKRALGTHGDILDEKELNEFVKEAAPDTDGRLNYMSINTV